MSWENLWSPVDFPLSQPSDVPNSGRPSVQVGAAVAAHDQDVLAQHGGGRREAWCGQLGAGQPALSQRMGKELLTLPSGNSMIYL